MAELLIHELCEILNINPKTIRFYEQENIIPKARRNKSNYRVYDESDVKLIDFIRKARGIDFSLDDIKDIIRIKQTGDVPCKKVIATLEKKINDLDSKIKEMIDFKKGLEKNLVEFNKNKDKCSDGVICGLIENFT